MGVFDYLSDLYESWAITTVEAEEPQKDDEGEYTWVRELGNHIWHYSDVATHDG
jgi:hypothetical protein